MGRSVAVSIGRKGRVGSVGLSIPGSLVGLLSRNYMVSKALSSRAQILRVIPNEQVLFDKGYYVLRVLI